MDQEECLPFDIDVEMADKVVRPIVKFLCPTIIVFQSILLLVSLKWRKYINAELYLEMTYFLVLYMNPTLMTTEKYFYNDNG